MPSTKLANTGGAKIGGGCEKEKSFIQVRPHFLWNISELSIRLLIFFPAINLSLPTFIWISYQIYEFCNCFLILLMVSLNVQKFFCLIKELNHWKRPWYWERLKAGGEGDNRGCDGWIASPTRWTWVWASSGSWWWTGKLGVLQSMGSQRVRHDWATELS